MNHLPGMKSFADSWLYTFIDLAYIDPSKVTPVSLDLCQGGADVIQFRAKETPLSIVRRLSMEVLRVTRDFNIPLVINDYPDIAIEIGAVACHLGQEDLAHRKNSSAPLNPAPLKTGLSTHRPEEALQAVALGVDYIGVGPVFPTPTKPHAKPVTLEYVRWAAANLSIPWFAIGGITLENLSQVMEAGASRVCVVSGILRAPNLREACQEFKKRLTSGPAT